MTEDDPVVKEIPVFLSKTLENKLYVLNYPAYYKDYGTAPCYKVAIKPKNQKLRMELLIDTRNKESYDDRVGEVLAENADGQSKETDENEKMFNSGLMDKITLSSEGLFTKKSNYAVGIFQDDELHITSIKNVLHMKMKYEYLDQSDKRIKEGMKSSEDDDEDEEISSPVKVTFSRNLPDNVKKKQEQSFLHHAKKSQEEPWIHPTYISSYDTQAELTRMEMFSRSPESLIALNLEPTQYLEQILPQAPNCSQKLLEDQSELNCIQTMPLLDQIRTIIKRSHIISFVKLCQILSSEHDPTMVLKCLQQVAVLVQGNWIVNSELIYPYTKDKDAKDNINELMCKARDYILSLFMEHQFVKRNMFSSLIKLNSEELHKILENIAICESKKGWRLKQSPDSSFCESHREIVQRQELLWDAKRKHLRESLLETQNHPPQRQRRKSQRESIGSENEERNVGRNRKSVKDSSLSDDNTAESKHKKNRSRKASETM